MKKEMCEKRASGGEADPREWPVEAIRVRIHRDQGSGDDAAG